jgi:putative transposase
MIKQDLEQGMPVVGEVIAELQEFIAQNANAREVRKGLAIKLVYQGYLYEEIQTILGVSLGSITGWKQVYEENGIDGLKLKYKGRKSYLNTEQKQEVLCWLQTKDYWEIGELEYKLAFEYDVVYDSRFAHLKSSYKKAERFNQGFRL